MMTSNISQKSIWCCVNGIYYFYIFLIYTEKRMYDKCMQITLGHVWTASCCKWLGGTEQRSERKSTAIPTSFLFIIKKIDNIYSNNFKAKLKNKKKKKNVKMIFHMTGSLTMSSHLKSFHSLPVIWWVFEARNYIITVTTTV